jgi:hypothetical protein
MASQAQTLAKALNVQAKSAQFSASKARATARADLNVDWNATKHVNDGFNPEVDGCESFVMKDGSVCEWSTPSNSYHAKPK